MGNCSNSKKQNQEQKEEEFSDSDYDFSDSEIQYNNQSTNMYKYVVKNNQKQLKQKGHIMKRPKILYLPYKKECQKKKLSERNSQAQQPEFRKSISIVTEQRFSHRFND